MALPVSVSDLVAVGEFAFSLYNQCRGAAADFQDCAELCNHVSLIIQGCRPDKPDSVLRAQDEKNTSLLADSCTRTLEKFEKMLKRYDSLSSANHKVRETLGFAYSRRELDKIRRRLNEQLLVITAFASGTRVNTPTTTDEETPDLFFALYTVLNESRSALSIGGSSFSAQDLENEVEWKDFRDKVALRAGLTSEALDEKKLYVKACVRRIGQESASLLAEQQSDTTSPALKDASESPSLVSGRDTSNKVPDVTSPAKSKGNYEPSQYPWYSAIGHSYLWKIRSGFEFMFPEPPCIWGYSEDEQWLSRLPEGYSRTATMLYRQKKLEKAYYYSYNNLSCREGNRPRTSRAYFSIHPFSCDEHLLRAQDVQKIRSVDWGWQWQFNIVTGRSEWMMPGMLTTKPFGPFGPTRGRWLEDSAQPVVPSNLSTAAGSSHALPPRIPMPFIPAPGKLAFVG